MEGESTNSSKKPLLSGYNPDDEMGKRTFSNIERISMGDKSLFPVQLKVANLKYCIKDKKILNDISCTFQPGQCVAIMGPSGAGKTTLLNVLLGNTAGQLKGKVTFNNVDQTRIKRGMKQVSSLVPQEDVLLPALTARETLRYAARLRLPAGLSRAKKMARVEEVLTQLALTDCADTRVGDVGRRGISGGQRKRVSIGTELLINPSVMFVDEPTSGLDSAMAEGVTTLLGELAREGRTLVCTIHQPSYRIFMGFDRLLLLSQGRVCYDGPTAFAEDYFGRLGLDPPRHENPVDFYMRVLLDDKKGPYLTDCWRHNDPEANARYAAVGEVLGGGNSPLFLPKEEEMLRLNERDYLVSRWTHFLVLLERFLVDYLKDPDKFVAGLLLKTSVGILQGLCWLDQAGTTQDSIFPVTGVLFASIMSCVMDTLFATVMRFPLQRALLIREYKNGVFSLPPYYAASLISSMLFQSIFAVFMGIPLYFLVGLDPNPVKVFLFLGNMCLLSCIGASLGLLIGCLVKDVTGAQQAVMPTVVPLLLFGGYVIPYSKIPIYFRWLYWVSYFQYAYSISSIIQFHDWVASDCDPYAPTDGCPAPACFPDGERYLASAHLARGDLPRDFGCVLAFYAGFVIIGYYVMKKMALQKTN